MAWQELPQGGQVPEIPARSSHTITSIQDTLYMFGGEHLPRTPIDSIVHTYNLKTMEWHSVKANGVSPTARIAPTAVAVNAEIFVFGGRTGVTMGEGALQELWRFNTVTSTWTQLQAKQDYGPPARSFHTMAALGTNVYVFGGCGQGGRLNDLWQMDTATIGADNSVEWRQLPSSSSIQGRGGSGLIASADGLSLYVIAGFSGREMNDVHRFDVSTQQWDCDHCPAELGDSTLPARSVFGLSVHPCGTCEHKGRILVFGGEVDPSDLGHEGAGKFSSELWSFDPDQPEKSWTLLEVAGRVPSARGWFASCQVPQGIVVHGGNSPSNERLADMYLLDLHSS